MFFHQNLITCSISDFFNCLTSNILFCWSSFYLEYSVSLENMTLFFLWKCNWLYITTTLTLKWPIIIRMKASFENITSELNFPNVQFLFYVLRMFLFDYVNVRGTFHFVILKNLNENVIFKCSLNVSNIKFYIF